MSTGKSFKDYHDQFPDAHVVGPITLQNPEQLEHRYVDALGVLVDIEGAGRFAAGCEIISKMFGVPLTQVVADAASFA